MADLVIPQGTSGQNFFGFFNNYYIFGQTFKSPTSSLNSVTLTLDSANMNGWWYGNNSVVTDVRYIVMIKDLATNAILYTSAEQVLAAIPGESSQYGAVHEFRDVTVALGNTAVNVGGSYAIMVQVMDSQQYVETSANSNNPYADGHFFYSWGGDPQSTGYEIYNWDMTMTLNGGPSNSAPVAAADTATASEDGGVVTINVLANDTDADGGDTKTLVSVNTAGTVGAVTANADGSVSYNPGANFQSLAPWQSAQDTFTYTMKDRAGAESTATVTVTVQGANDAPVANPDGGTALENGASVRLAVTNNDTDVDSGDLLMVQSVDTRITKGTVEISGNSINYTAGGAFDYLAAGATTLDSFFYTVRDVDGATSTAPAMMLVVGVNDAPLAANDTATVQEDQSVTIDVLGNDSDVDVGDGKTIVSVSASQEGASVAIVDGKIVYTADGDTQDLLGLGQTSTDILTYVMADSAGVQSTATVTVTVAGVANGADVIGTNKSDAALNGTALDEKIEGGNGDDVMNGMGGWDVLLGGNGSDQLNGGAGIDMLYGENGTDILNGGAGDDFLTGGEGKDTFAFSGAFGKDIVHDFKAQNDTIKIDSALLANFAAVLSHATEQTGQYPMVVINIDANTSIALMGVSLADLSAKDFIFA